MKIGFKKETMPLDVNYPTIWDEYQMKYMYLKQQFIEISASYISAVCLMTLKKKYDSIINSKREADNIKDLHDLLRILENRAILRYNKIDALKYIGSEFIKNSVLNRIIQEYELNIQSQLVLPLFNVYKGRSSTPTSSAVPKPVQIPTDRNHNTTTHSRVQSPDIIQQVLNSNESSSGLYSSEQQIIVFKQLSEGLDRYWRDLARFLDVTESEIDEIDRNTSSQSHDKAFKALEIFGRRTEPSRWRVKLIQALKDVRRRDLTEVVDRILNSSS